MIYCDCCKHANKLHDSIFQKVDVCQLCKRQHFCHNAPDLQLSEDGYYIIHDDGIKVEAVLLTH